MYLLPSSCERLDDHFEFVVQLRRHMAYLGPASGPASASHHEKNMFVFQDLKILFSFFSARRLSNKITSTTLQRSSPYYLT